VNTLRLNAKDPDAIRQAAEIVRAGGLVAFPTETVYGLGANALSAAAVKKIFAAKERPAWDPVIVHVSSLEMLRGITRELPPNFKKLARAFMPGPLTLLVARNGAVPDEVTAGRPLVAVRMPAHPVARALIEAAGVPIAAPSANRFGRPSPTSATHVKADLDGRIDAILDGGETQVGVESTVLDTTQPKPMILRPGGVSREALESVLGEVAMYTPPAEAEATPPESQPAPGLGVRHYAPEALLELVPGDASEVGKAVRRVTMEGLRAGVMLPHGWRNLLPQRTPVEVTCFEWGRWGDWEDLAHRLYQGLRWLDDQQVETIICPLPPAEGIGLALRDRLLKAAR
jgi:L-threonylcarbamoyladenylate synthase